MKPYYKNSYVEAKFGDIWHLYGMDFVLLRITTTYLHFANTYGSQIIEYTHELIEWRVEC